MNKKQLNKNKIIPSKYSHIIDDDTLIFFLHEYLSAPLEMKWSIKQGVKQTDEVAYVFGLDDFLYRYLFKRLYEQREWRKLDYAELVMNWQDICSEIKSSKASEVFMRMCEEATKRYAMAKDLNI